MIPPGFLDSTILHLFINPTSGRMANYKRELDFMGLIFEQDERDLWWLDFCKSLGYLFTRGAGSLCLNEPTF